MKAKYTVKLSLLKQLKVVKPEAWNEVELVKASETDIWVIWSRK